jgi:peptidoglycan/LPS O-acetylase OafA/YrhL
MHRFTALDSWRGICACLVAVFHISKLHPNSHIALLPFLGNAWLFVDYFFVLSGFVIAANYQDRLGNGFGVGKFMLLRFGRVYPLHLVMLLAFIAVELVELSVPAFRGMGQTEPFAPPGQSPDTILANLLLVHSLNVYEFDNWNTPSWSISTEFYTYLIFALAIVVFRSRLAIALIVAVIVGPMIIGLFSERHMDTTYDFGIVRCVYGFAAGVIVYRVWLRYEGQLRGLLERPGTALALEAAMVLAVGIFVSVAGTDLVSVLAPYVFGPAVFVFAFQAGPVSRLLLWRPFLVLGVLSYSIYMVHDFIIRQLKNVETLAAKLLDIPLITFVGEGEHQQRWIGTEFWHGDVFTVAVLLLIVGSSFLTYRLVEEPGRRWVRRLTRHA